VVFSPSVAVRDAPWGRKVGTKAQGDVVSTDMRSVGDDRKGGGWVRLEGGYEGGEGWMLLHGAALGLGTLLEARRPYVPHISSTSRPHLLHISPTSPPHLPEVAPISPSRPPSPPSRPAAPRRRQCCSSCARARGSTPRTATSPTCAPARRGSTCRRWRSSLYLPSISPLDLAYISPISPVYLPCIGDRGGAHLGLAARDLLRPDARRARPPG
jgi:hypothetical protein